MKRLIVLALMFGLAANAQAMDSDGLEATYTSGTIPGVRPGADGTVETTSPIALEFHSSSGNFSVLYTGIVTARYNEENRFRLGVLPAIAVGLLKARSKRYLVTISWTDERGVVQAAMFETSKEKSRALLTIVRVRAPQVCSSQVNCLNAWTN